MESGHFWEGAVIGFSIAAPVGPIGILCIRRTLAHGRLHGFLSGLGAAAADAVYGAVAGFGLAGLSSFLVEQGLVLRLMGGAFLLYLAVRTFLARPVLETAPQGSEGPEGSEASRGRQGSRWRQAAAAFGSTFFLTLTNPMTIISFGAIFAGLGAAQASVGAAGLLVAGVFAGSALWWLLLSQGAGLFRRGLRPEGLRWVNRLSGLILAAFGLAILVGAASGGGPAVSPGG